jgi:hypothetical protein
MFLGVEAKGFLAEVEWPDDAGCLELLRPPWGRPWLLVLAGAAVVVSDWLLGLLSLRC